MPLPTPDTLQAIATGVFALALLHTFCAHLFERLATRLPRHAGLLHLLGEVEVVFGFWAIVLTLLLALVVGPAQSLDYIETRNYTEPLFVFVVMVIAGSRPILDAVFALVRQLSGLTGGIAHLSAVWLGLAGVPLLGSLITEPAAMTIAALLLAPLVFMTDLPERLKYLALGVLFVNVSIGGTLTAYAAPPVLMVAGPWGWDSAYMLQHFGWKSALAVLVNATLAVLALRRHLRPAPLPRSVDPQAQRPVPPMVTLIHALLLAGVVALAHHPVAFIGLFLLFMGYTTAYARHQTPLLLKEALLVAFFLAGLVVLGGLQRWWLQPVVSGLEPLALFFGALGLTAITDNAALTYLGTQIDGLSETARHMLVAGAVAGGGLTVIANAPNPAGAALLRAGFTGGSINLLGLLAGALAPTAVAASALLLLG
jgi:hypothetical protein